MKDLLDIYNNIENYIPDNRIDGVFIGQNDSLLEHLFNVIKEEWQILVVGNLKSQHDIFENIKDGYYAATISKANKKNLLTILNKAYIEVLYVFDASGLPMVLIDDYPEDITVNMDIFNI